jgi:hypothetical protein
MRRVADYTLGLAIVITHLFMIAVRERRLAMEERHSLPSSR